ncbi:MAG: aminotransferase class V-fold PLP-dependent enzyme [Clostridia bacterium]|nr:aminotransferase class V-fold PLP-dependent enzyme [Clostridia bacterium]
MNTIYLDNNSTTSVLKEVLQSMMQVLEDNYGNPSSIHHFGLRAKEVLETSRRSVAEFLGAQPQNIIFTSGGTESNNLVIRGYSETLCSKKHFITTTVEHSSVLKVFEKIESLGHRVTYLPVDNFGMLHTNQIEEAIEKDTAMISVMAANNETGVIFPVNEIGEIAKKHRILFHCDAVQGAGKIPINIHDFNVDFLTISAHKFHGPKGVGALFIRNSTLIEALSLGGNQEKGKRSGTEALANIVGMGNACEIAKMEMENAISQMAYLRDYLEDNIMQLYSNARVNGIKEARVCNTSNICFRNFSSTFLLEELSNQGVLVSHGSACSSRYNEGSHVLRAMGLDDMEVSSSIRFSLSKQTTKAQIDKTLEVLHGILNHTSSANMSASEVRENDSMDDNPVYEDFIKELHTVWNETVGDENISIAIIDGPVDIHHPCFRNSQLKYNNSILKSHSNEISKIHGTHVASIIFGEYGDELKAIAPKCRGIIIPAFSDGRNGPSCSQLDLARAITVAVQEGANIINISGGELVSGGESESHLQKAVSLCRENGVLIVAAAGNDGCDCLHVPAAMPSVLAVGALDAFGNPLLNSNYGIQYKNQGILAPGENIIGAIPHGGLGKKTGTSFATPLVAGVLALMLSIQNKNNNKIDTEHAMKVLLESAFPCDSTEISNCQRFLKGKLNIKGAVELLKNTDKKEKGGIILMNDDNNTDVNVSVQELAVSHSEKNAVSLSACGGAPSKPAYVYAIGQVGFDFGTEARRDFFVQMGLPNPSDPSAMLQYLEKQPWHADSMIWTLNQDTTPIYAIIPSGAFGAEGYKLLREFLHSQISPEIVERVSIPGVVVGNVTLMSGQVVPVISPELRGMYSWSTSELVKAVAGEQNTSNEQKIEGVTNFLERVYYEVRNLGITSQDRAMNFAATNAYQVEKVYEVAVNENMSLDTISVEKSPICRPGSDCWDIKLIFFNPAKRIEQARQVYRFTVDVSDVVPVTVGKVRSWHVF